MDNTFCFYILEGAQQLNYVCKTYLIRRGMHNTRSCETLQSGTERSLTQEAANRANAIIIDYKE
jgi:hypothetical protein